MNWMSGTSSFGGHGDPRRCSFCGRREATVDKLVHARGTYICDRCVDQAHEAIASAHAGQTLLRIRPPTGRVTDRDAAEQAVAALTPEEGIGARAAVRAIWHVSSVCVRRVR